jgi:predicted nucleic acid-binding protein
LSRLFLDANVPTYAAGREHPLKGPCREVLRLAALHPRAFFTDAEVLQELLHRYLALRRWPEGKKVVLDFAALMEGSVEPVLAEDVVLACALADRHAAGSPGAGRLAARDLLHAAVVLRLAERSAEGSAEGSGRIVSADGDFDELAGSGIRRLDPADVGSWRREAEGRGT